MQNKAKRLRLVGRGKGTGASSFQGKTVNESAGPTHATRREKLLYELHRIEEHFHKALTIARETDGKEHGFHYQSIEDATILAMHMGGMIGHAVMGYRDGARSVFALEQLTAPKHNALESIFMSAELVIKELATVGLILEGIHYKALAVASMPRSYKEKIGQHEVQHEDSSDEETVASATGEPAGLGQEGGNHEGGDEESEDVSGTGAESDSDSTVPQDAESEH